MSRKSYNPTAILHQLWDGEAFQTAHSYLGKNSLHVRFILHGTVSAHWYPKTGTQIPVHGLSTGLDRGLTRGRLLTSSTDTSTDLTMN